MAVGNESRFSFGVGGFKEDCEERFGEQKQKKLNCLNGSFLPSLSKRRPKAVNFWLCVRNAKEFVKDLSFSQDQHGDKNDPSRSEATSTPSKKLGGLFWDRSNDAAKLEEELMTTKLHETAAVAELKEARLKVGCSP